MATGGIDKSGAIHAACSTGTTVTTGLLPGGDSNHRLTAGSFKLRVRKPTSPLQDVNTIHVVFEQRPLESRLQAAASSRAVIFNRTSPRLIGSHIETQPSVTRTILMTAPFHCEEETPGDELAIDRVVMDAFRQDAEAWLVKKLRASNSLVFSAVGKLADEIVAHIAFSEVSIGGQTSRPPVLALAPVAVAPGQQRRGFGSRLIRWSLEQLSGRGFPAVIVLGEPEFYSRFGFQPAWNWRITAPGGVAGEYFMALELQPGGLTGLTGVVGYRPEFAALS